MYISKDRTMITSVAIPASLRAKMTELLGPRERSQFIVNAVRDALEIRQAQLEATSTPKFQLPLIERITQ